MKIKRVAVIICNNRLYLKCKLCIAVDKICSSSLFCCKILFNTVFFKNNFFQKL